MDLATSSPIISGATYGPGNEMLTMSGNVNETRTYNSMRQLKQVYNGAINFSYNYPSSNNNGKIASQTDNVSAEQVVYSYDALNRLATATATSYAWGQSYSYDGFGNLTGQTVTYGSAPSYSASPNPSTNAVGSTDANGNASYINISGTNLPATYDVSNRLVSVGYGNISYGYAPGNKRVWSSVTDPNSGLTTEWVTFWSITGQKLATYGLTVGSVNMPCYPQYWEWCFAGTLTATQTGTNYYFGRKLIKNSTAYGYVAADRLGSVGKYYPYGQEKPSATTNGTEKFTGYFRDAETGLDYADQRFHNPGTGRFLTPDPYMAKAKGANNPRNPGSWNRYAYVGGDPVNRVDHRGLEYYGVGDDDDESDDGTCGVDWMTDASLSGPCGGGDGGGGNGACPVGQYFSTTSNNCVDDGNDGDDNSDPTCTMTMYTRGLTGIWSILGTFATHSYLVLTETVGNSSSTVTIDGLHQGKKLTDEVVTLGLNGGKYGYGNNPSTSIDDGTFEIPCDDIQLAENAAQAFMSNPPNYGVLGPNSNSFMHWLLDAIGEGTTYSAPLGSWGWNWLIH